MEIKPRTGIGEFTFGMTADEVVAKLGQPDKTWNDDEDDNQVLYQYNKLKLRLTFYEDEDGRLGYIRCAHPTLTYQGKQVIFAPINKVKQEVFGKPITDWVEEDYDFFTTCVNDEYWVVLNVEYDEVTEVELGVPIRTDDTYEWPGE